MGTVGGVYSPWVLDWTWLPLHLRPPLRCHREWATGTRNFGIDIVCASIASNAFASKAHGVKKRHTPTQTDRRVHSHTYLIAYSLALFLT